MLNENEHDPETRMRCLVCRAETCTGAEIHITVDEKEIKTFNEIFPKFFPSTKPIKEPINKIVLLPLCEACRDFVPPIMIRLVGIFTILRRRGLIDERLLG